MSCQSCKLSGNQYLKFGVFENLLERKPNDKLVNLWIRSNCSPVILWNVWDLWRKRTWTNFVKKGNIVTCVVNAFNLKRKSLFIQGFGRLLKGRNFCDFAIFCQNRESLFLFEIQIKQFTKFCSENKYILKCF